RNEAHQFLRYAQTGSSHPDLSRGFNTVLNYINASFDDFNGIPMQSNWIHPEHCDPGHHLRLQVHDFDASGNIQLYFDLNETVFPAPIRDSVPGHFLSLLDAFIANRSQAINAIPLLTQTKQEELTVQFNQQQSFDFNYQSIIQLFERQVAQKANATVLQFGQQKISYQVLNEKANQLARHLQAHGVQARDRVALHLTRSPELLMSILAAFKLGATYIPIPSNYPSGRVKEILEDAEAKILLSTNVLKPNLSDVQTPILLLDDHSVWASLASNNLDHTPQADQLAYIMYTSGSTGKPKGVMINHRSLSHYIQWASQKYAAFGAPAVPLFSSIGFDLTVTSLFIPLVSGGSTVIYEEVLGEPDLAVFKVIEDNLVDFIKLTPAHLTLLKGMDLADSRIKTMVVGGEDLKANLAQQIHQAFGGQISIYNEYGPTEATVGCIVQLFDPEVHLKNSVPIGLPIPNTQAYVLDEFLHPVPVGIPGELYLSGIDLAQGYWQQEALSQEKFTNNPFHPSEKMYQTGDLVGFNLEGGLTYYGRKDQQVKIRGRRIELGEIEETLSRYPQIQSCVVDLRERQQQTEEVHNCTKCGLPSNYPGVSFDEEGVCHICNSFESYQRKVSKYFKAPADLMALFEEARQKQRGEYDCLLLLSGGKDSSYALGQLIEMGMKVLTFTLDNGYISEQAKANVRRITNELGVDHIFGETPAMNEIFVDSLQRHCNVCDGCFKTIYTLSMKIALEKNIPFIITGLSRGQFFETRLTEELFNSEKIDVDEIDNVILNARKAYHRVDDAVKRLLDVSIFEDDAVFERVRFLDFYRYTDVSLEEMYVYLDKRLPWSRPTDTGRSTNCLINQAGIYVHKKEKGYSNYAFPYSWDVRIGHKTREASLDEINEFIDEPTVQRMLDEIGYNQAQEEHSEKLLVAYYVSEAVIEESALSQHLSTLLPEYMIPAQFIRLEAFPLTTNGKIDREALPKPDAIRPRLAIEYVAPRNDIEAMLTDIWSEVLHIDRIGVFDKFLHLGGHSLTAIRLTARINEALELDLPLNLIFQRPTIAAYAEYVEETIESLLADMNDAQTDA
ncbi:MAG: amino acid adenylation domain-containing protein, partial [Bacteroidota bacterium]